VYSHYPDGPGAGPGRRVLHIYYGDRWNADGPGGVGNASYVWLPLLLPPPAADASRRLAGGAGGPWGAPQGRARCLPLAAGAPPGPAARCMEPAGRVGGGGPGAGVGPPVHFQLRWRDVWSIADYV
jgi:hypothetical protein